MWQSASAAGTVQRLASLMNTQPMGFLGVSRCGDEEDWRYYIAMSSTADQGEFESYTVPAATWAIFSGAGNGPSIQDLERRAVVEGCPPPATSTEAPRISRYI